MLISHRRWATIVGLMMRLFLSFIFLISFAPLATGEEQIETFPQSAWSSGGAKPIPGRMKKHTKGITSIVIHHTETPNQLPASEVSRLVNIQRYHIEDRDWGDIAYHYLIGPSGKIYEGRDWRFQGDSGTKYDLNGRLLVCMIGSFTDTLPQEEAMKSLIHFVGSQMRECQVEPENLVTHRMVAATDCPGGALQQWFEKSGKEMIVKWARGEKVEIAAAPANNSPDSVAPMKNSEVKSNPRKAGLLVPISFQAIPARAVPPVTADETSVVLNQRYRSPESGCEFAVTVVKVGDLGRGEYDRLITWKEVEEGEEETSSDFSERDDTIVEHFGITGPGGSYTRYFNRSYSTSQGEDAFAVLWEFMVRGADAQRKWKDAYAEFKASLDLDQFRNDNQP